MPPQPSSKYADEGTLLHNVMAMIIETGCDPMSLVGTKYNDLSLTAELVEEKVLPALAALDEIDPDNTADIAVESHVDFGSFIPEAFGSTDVLMRVGSKAVVLDWKFGSGIPVDAEENPQLMFYACAAMRTPRTQWAFDGAETIELVIVQPPHIRRWEVSRRRLELFEIDLRNAVLQAQAPQPPIKHGDWCRFCPAKPICPAMTGAVERPVLLQRFGLNVVRDLCLSTATTSRILRVRWCLMHRRASTCFGISIIFTASVVVPAWKRTGAQ